MYNYQFYIKVLDPQDFRKQKRNTQAGLREQYKTKKKAGIKINVLVRKEVTILQLLTVVRHLWIFVILCSLY